MKQIFDALAAKISKERIQKYTEEIHRLEGDESYDNYKRSTDCCLELMRESGFEQVERHALAADGETTWFDLPSSIRIFRRKNVCWLTPLKISLPSIPGAHRPRRADLTVLLSTGIPRKRIPPPLPGNLFISTVTLRFSTNIFLTGEQQV